MICPETGEQTTIEAIRSYTNVIRSVDDLNFKFLDENLDEMNIDNSNVVLECMECGLNADDIEDLKKHVNSNGNRYKFSSYY